MIDIDIAIGALGVSNVAAIGAWWSDRRHARSIAAQLELAVARQDAAAVLDALAGSSLAPPTPPAAPAASRVRNSSGNGSPRRVFDPDAEPQPRDQNGHPVSKKRLAELAAASSGPGAAR